MTSRDFAYWLQGFFELNAAGAGFAMTGAQTAMVKRHLDLVFAHEIEPSAGDKTHQRKLAEIHGGGGEPEDGGIVGPPYPEGPDGTLAFC